MTRCIIKHQSVTVRLVNSTAAHIYHLLGDDLWDLVHQVKGELNGASVLVLCLELFGVLDPQLEGNGRLFAVVLLVELHPHARVLGKKGVIQEVFDGIPARCTHKTPALGPAQEGHYGPNDAQHTQSSTVCQKPNSGVDVAQQGQKQNKARQ